MTRRVHRVDRFVVPNGAREDFIGRVRGTHEFLRMLPGFVRDALLERMAGAGERDVVTIAVWESADALERARQAVAARHRATGFDPRETLARLGIEADFGTYEEADASESAEASGRAASEPPLRLAVIVGSTRNGRFGGTVARWFVEHARSRRDLALDVIDLVDLDLPATYPAEKGPEVKAYAERIGRAEAFVVITPEYNHGYPASLKQAIDLVHAEWHAKPVGFVSYGGTAGGLRAVEQLRQVFAEVHAVTVRNTVSFHHARRRFDESGRPIDPAGAAAAADGMLDQVLWWGLALRAARGGRPYPA